MQLPQYDRSCCGCSLRMGTLIIGFVESVYALIAMIGAIVLCTEIDKWESDGSEADYKDAAYAAYVVLAIASALQLLIAILLIGGVFMSKHGLFVPWLVYAGINALLALIVGIINCIVYFATSTAAVAIVQIVITIIFLCLKIYFVLIVYSLFRVLKGQAPGAAAYPGTSGAQPYGSNNI